MNTFAKDENNEEILLSNNAEQVMMEWEKHYMEASIDFLSPIGHVLEIGFGCGYSATKIMKYPIESYTVIECDPKVIEKAKKWRENYQKIPVEIIEGTWQETLSNLSIFDTIYFDDFPLNINKESSQLEIEISKKRLNLFMDLCIQNHTKIGSKISFYMNDTGEITLGSDTEPFIQKEFKEIKIKISNLCRYRDLKKEQCSIPLITKIKDYDFFLAQQFAFRYIQEILSNN